MSAASSHHRTENDGRRPSSDARSEAETATGTPTSPLDLPAFVFLLALAVLFQLARGDMGIVAAWRSTPAGTTFGDGWVPALWFCSALVALVFPTVRSLLLLAACGVIDFWWRLPVVPPSIFFHGLVSVQVLVTALGIAVSERRLTISGEAFIERLRAPILALLFVLFAFAVFHKFTTTAFYWTTGFFELLTGYYAPFYPKDLIPSWVHWSLTVGGEAAIAAALFFKRTRALAIMLLVGFAAFVGIVVYGFGSIVLAAGCSLGAMSLVLEPLRRTRAFAFFGQWSNPTLWRLVVAVGVAAIFVADHRTGFTLADRQWLFAPGEEPSTGDVVTPMQVLWFVFSGALAVSAGLAYLTYGQRLAAVCPRPRSVLLLASAALLTISEAGLYTGLKDTPNVAMFAGLRVMSRTPNHFILRDRLLSSFFHRDLLLVDRGDGQGRLAIPPLSLLERRRREERLGVVDSQVSLFRGPAPITRLRNGQEEPFDFERLGTIEPSFFEMALPRRLFMFSVARERDLRASMPELFATSADDSTEPSR